ncbi:DUF3179 domain-containing protein [Gracilimonas halophila]|uniref:DUF3179 domain-containing protein n=1 Tax=Gracilimonas halophila TaxID=1834464 RepID=A0ABW5JH65_9BACT
MKSISFSLIIFFTLSVVSCDKVTDSDPETEFEGQDCSGGNWLIPCQQVVDGGPDQDGIPSIDRPEFSSVSETTFLEDWELVVGVKVGDVIKAYPHVILYYHEIVNDEVGGIPIALTFCPLTGSGIGWERTINGEVTEFGVSGLIHKNNLIPYDRNTGSRWSQMLNKSVNGDLKGLDISTVKVVEMTWGSWKEAFPDSEVLNTNTGFSRNYDKYLYGEDYPTNSSRILFPIYQEDERLDRKTLVHGINIGFVSKVYPISLFDSQLQVINDNFEGEKILIVGSSEMKVAVSFFRTLSDGTELEFEPVSEDLPVIAEDQEGNQWNIFGEAVSGPRKGEKLNHTGGYNAYWFAWADFFNFPEINRF